MTPPLPPLPPECKGYHRKNGTVKWTPLIFILTAILTAVGGLTAYHSAGQTTLGTTVQNHATTEGHPVTLERIGNINKKLDSLVSGLSGLQSGQQSMIVKLTEHTASHNPNP